MPVLSAQSSLINGNGINQLSCHISKQLNNTQGETGRERERVNEREKEIDGKKERERWERKNEAEREKGSGRGCEKREGGVV